MARYRIVSWEFNKALWAATITDWMDRIGPDDLAALLECEKGTLKTWSYMAGNPNAHQWPSMLYFMRVVNLLDLNPADFFVLEV